MMTGLLPRSRVVEQYVERCSNSNGGRSEEHTSELQSRQYLVCRLLLEKKKHNRPATSRDVSTGHHLLPRGLPPAPATHCRDGRAPLLPRRCTATVEQRLRRLGAVVLVR